MRKTIGDNAGPNPAGEMTWLNLDVLADVEVTSEAPDRPIEHALRGSDTEGWQAAAPGPQTIRILFHAPTTLRRIDLWFEEHSAARTQEFVLRWSGFDGRAWEEIVRQSYTFSTGTANEYESYGVNLSGVKILELSIIPDIRGEGAIATLKRWRVV
jgi:hypothetical protein